MSEAPLAAAVRHITPLLPVPMDLTLLVSSLAVNLGTNLRVTGAPFSTGSTTGALATDSNGDLTIIFDVGADPAHQLHIVLHEIGHLLLGHQLITTSGEDLPNLLTHPLRCPQTPDQEVAAEEFATAIVAIVSVMPADLSERSRSSSILL